MERQASGSFEVEMTPEASAESTIGRFSLVKRFHGDLQADSTGAMLTVRTATAGSAGYVAIERVVGTLDRRAGSFALQHSGTMQRGQAVLSLTVVPDSGTEALTGLSGSMSIEITDGRHAYLLRYALPSQPGRQDKGSALDPLGPAAPDPDF